jgi:hypothetical protein
MRSDPLSMDRRLRAGEAAIRRTMTDGRFVPPNGYLGPVNLTGPYDLPFSLAGQITAPLFRFDRSSPRIDRST